MHTLHDTAQLYHTEYYPLLPDLTRRNKQLDILRSQLRRREDLFSPPYVAASDLHGSRSVRRSSNASLFSLNPQSARVQDPW